MGGGNSKLNAGEAVAVPAKIRPILVRRFEELKKRRSSAKLQVEGTLSKKQLLKDAEDEDSNSQSSHEECREPKKEDKVSTKEIQLAKEEMGARAIATEKLSRVVPLPNSEYEVEEEKDSSKGNVEKDNKHNDDDDQEKVKDSNKSNVEQDNKHSDHDDQEKVKASNKSNVGHSDNQEKVKDPNNKSNVEQDNKHNDHDDQEKVICVGEKAEAGVKIEKGKATDPKRDNGQDVGAKSDDDDDDDDEDKSEEFGMFLPGSPSFRIYCIEAEKRQEEELKKQIVATHQKSRSADSVVSQPSQSENSGNLNEVLPVVEIESSTKRKGNKVKKFGAVKTLLKVKSCYHPMCSCTGDERRHLIAAKAAN